MDDFGSPASYNHYSVGWASAMCTPFQWTKQVASYWGGTRNGTIVHWPHGIDKPGGLRSQFTHVIEVAPTILEAAGLPEPTVVNGVQQSPMKGRSMLFTLIEQAPPFDDDVWELYDGHADYSQAHDMAKDQPEMLAKLQRRRQRAHRRDATDGLLGR